jgi:hypothetical protein
MRSRGRRQTTSPGPGRLKHVKGRGLPASGDPPEIGMVGSSSDRASEFVTHSWFGAGVRCGCQSCQPFPLAARADNEPKACLHRIYFVDIHLYGAVTFAKFPVWLQDGKWPPEGKLSSSSISPRGFLSSAVDEADDLLCPGRKALRGAQVSFASRAVRRFASP